MIVYSIYDTINEHNFDPEIYDIDSIAKADITQGKHMVTKDTFCDHVKKQRELSFGKK